MSDPLQPGSPSTPHRGGSPLSTHLAPLRRNSGWLLAAGVVLILLGFAALVFAAAFSIASALWFGVIVLAGGLVLLVDAFSQKGWKSRLWHLVIGVLYVAVGLFTIVNPVVATASLTLLAGAAFVATGVVRLLVAFQNRSLPFWGMIAFSGVLSLLLGLLILMQWPASSLWVLGTFFGIELLFQGAGMIALARAIRSTFDGR